ncbi:MULTISPECIES: DUF6894 family protein [unclassified Mesorhizobium]|uniref:DUF6894 family protein n=1 Tax=unclassified Mesorhizobium TaxID=325217 RepID=UPI00112C09E2|nr:MULTISPECIES: hypothetical protein [unclassified Mesorhizobium]MBZ9739728.1 hypothetical protein [Mesorhizobium sp. CO1-1-4]MBZ9805008.1 hypothetical protein [Mesorhizobium sp. ES1-6]TPL88748.1 hypothetical protein FJ948_21350 [Mesorhizobium sp. B2-3-12]
MALYYFDLTDNGTAYPDTEGTDLPSLQSAEDEAAKALLEIAKDKMPDGTFREVALYVHDGSSKPIFVVKVTFELIRNGSDARGTVGT